MTDPIWGDQHGAIVDLLQDHATSIEEVIKKMEALKGMFLFIPDGPGPLAAFNVLYHEITTKILAEREVGGFQDVGFLTALDLQFARRYFDALLSWTMAEEQTPRCWSSLFAKRDSDGITDMQGMISGIVNHIHYDLPQALVATFTERGLDPGAGQNGLPVEHQDYDKINQIFFGSIPELRRAAYTDHWQVIFDALSGTLDDHVDSFFVTEARAIAWRESIKLWALRSDRAARDEYVQELDTTVTHKDQVIFIRGVDAAVF